MEKQFILAYLHGLNVKTVLLQTIQFSINTLFSSIWPIDRTVSEATGVNLGAIAIKV